MKKCNLNMLDDRILIKPDTPEQTSKGGIIIPEKTRSRPEGGLSIGTVVKVGPGKMVDGKRIPLELKSGDRVLFGHYGGLEVEHEGEKYKMMWEKDVFLRITTKG